MKRLTLSPVDYSEVGVVENMRTSTLAAMICKLSAYEDTGLEPEDVCKWKDALSKLTHTTGDRILEIANAEREGRLIVLPCKLRDTVYIERHYVPEIQETKVDRFHFDSEGIYCLTRNDDKKGGWDGQGRIGRNVFLTRKEAEDAMKAHINMMFKAKEDD